MDLQSPTILTLEQIRQRHDGEWVLIAYTEIDRNLQTIKGEVLAHSIDRDEVYRAVSKAKGRDFAIECFVNTPEDMAFIPLIFWEKP
jgi:hypothetical protein